MTKKAKKRISIAFSGYIVNGQDGSASLTLISNDVYDGLELDRIDRRFEGDEIDIELVIDEDGNILEGLEITTEADVEGFNNEIED